MKQSGVFIRAIERSYLFDENHTTKVAGFIENCRATNPYIKTDYEIQDRYFLLECQHFKKLNGRIRSEITTFQESVNLVVECSANRYFISPNPDDGYRNRKPIAEIQKLRTDWTRRFGPKASGMHYGSFSRISIDRCELGRLEDSAFRRTYPGKCIIEFEYSGIGKKLNVSLMDDFLDFCADSNIDVAVKARGLKGRKLMSGRGLQEQ